MSEIRTFPSADLPSLAMVDVRQGLRSALLVAVVLAVTVAGTASPAAAGPKPTDPEELFNPLLGPDWATWLSGAISWIATEKEIEEFLLLGTDEEAEAFARAFWAGRAEDVAPFQKTPEQLFEARSETADSRFSEGAWPGRRTDRGTILIVYGEPESIEFESGQKVGEPTQEVWKYAKDAEEGLDGEKPERRYRFYSRDGKTVFWDQRARLIDPRKRIQKPGGRWN